MDHIACLDAVQEIQKPDTDYGRVVDFIKRNVSLTYGLFRYVNSEAIGICTRVHGIRQELLLLGQKEAARRLSLVALRQLAGRPNRY